MRAAVPRDRNVVVVDDVADPVELSRQSGAPFVTDLSRDDVHCKIVVEPA